MQFILQITYNDTFGTLQTFSPIFNKEWMLRLLKLQKDLEGIVTPKNGVTLKDVCYAPMSPQDTVCAIQNVWAYWQDDPEKLDLWGINGEGHNDTYLDHLLVCTR